MHYSLKLLLIIGFFAPQAEADEFDLGPVQNLINSGGGGSVTDTLIEALHLTTHKGLKKSKLSGPFKPFVETGGNIFDVNNSQLAFAIDTGFSPDSFKNYFVRGGVGFPYGIEVDGGFSYVINDTNFGSVYTNAKYQFLDLVNEVYTDMVPSAAVSVGFNYIVDGPTAWALQSSLALGAYHRFLWSQINYVLQVTYGQITDLNPAQDKLFIRHGLASYWPVFEGIFVTQDVFIEPLEATASVGYRF